MIALEEAESLQEKDKLYYIWNTVLASLIWGSSFIVNKVGLEYVDAFNFSFLRFLIASITIIPVAISLRRIRLSLFKNKLIWLVGAFNAAGFLFQYLGMTYTTASKSSLLVNSSVIIVAILSFLIFKEKFSNQKKLGVFAGFLGSALLATGGNLTGLVSGEFAGNVLVFLAGVFWAFFMVSNKKMVSEETDLTEMTVCVMVITAIVQFPFAFLFGTTNLATMAWQGWGAIVFTAIFCSTVTYFLWSEGLKGITVTTSAITLLLEVVWAMILAFFILHEGFTVVASVGAILIMASILLAAK
ncbi:MAG: DMT family transporter [Promethearchaeota archaeon]